MAFTKVERRNRIRKQIRSKIVGSAEIPRLSVFRSNKEIYAQIIDDKAGHTLAAFSSRTAVISSQKITKSEKAKLVGTELAKIATAKGISNVVFDRGGYLYHGRVKQLAEGAREGGLIF